MFSPDCAAIETPVARSASALEGPRHRHRKDIGLAVEGCGQTVDALVFEDAGEFGAAGRQFADRAIEVDVGDQPALTVAAHHVVDLDRLTVGINDPAAHHDPGPSGLFAGHFELLPRIAVEAV